jgi:hypothetical protein
MGLYWFLSHDLGLSSSIREAMSDWGLCADEFPNSDPPGWPPTLYTRETRRMVGDRVLDQNTVREGSGSDIGNSSLGLSAHAEDSHNTMRFACESPTTPPCYSEGPGDHRSGAFAWNEGDFYGVDAAHIYQVSRL